MLSNTSHSIGGGSTAASPNVVKPCPHRAAAVAQSRRRRTAIGTLLSQPPPEQAVSSTRSRGGGSIGGISGGSMAAMLTVVKPCLPRVATAARSAVTPGCHGNPFGIGCLLDAWQRSRRQRQRRQHGRLAQRHQAAPASSGGGGSISGGAGPPREPLESSRLLDAREAAVASAAMSAAAWPSRSTAGRARLERRRRLNQRWHQATAGTLLNVAASSTRARRR